MEKEKIELTSQKWITRGLFEPQEIINQPSRP